MLAAGGALGARLGDGGEFVHQSITGSKFYLSLVEDNVAVGPHSAAWFRLRGSASIVRRCRDTAAAAAMI